MGDFAPISPLAGGAQLIRLNPDPQAARLAPVAASADSRGAQARMDTGTQPRRPDSRDKQPDADAATTARTRREIDEFTIAGPSPAFQANVLEIERDLQRSIERLEEARSRIEAETAIKIQKTAPKAGAAEADAPKRTGAQAELQETDPTRPATAQDLKPEPASPQPLAETVTPTGSA